MGRGFDKFAGNDRKDNLREDDLFEMFKLSKEAADTWITVRLMPGDILPLKKHWIELEPKDDKKQGVKIPRMCVSFDPDNTYEPLEGRKCPYCEIPHQNKENPNAPAQYDTKFLACAIIRDIQEAGAPRKSPEHTKAEKKTGFKEPGSKSWTPIRVLPLTGGNVKRVNEHSERNMHKQEGKKGKVAYPVNHAKYGCDLEIRFRTGKGIAPGDRYQIEKGEVTPLTKEEKAYLTFDFSDWEGIYDKLGRLDTEGALRDFKKLDVRGLGLYEEEDDEDEDEMSLGRKKKKSSDKKKKTSRLLDDDEDDEDDRPKKKKKRRDDDDEDEAPKKKKKKTKSLLDDDDDEDEKPKKKKKKKKSSDDDEAPKKKKKKKKK